MLLLLAAASAMWWLPLVWHRAQILYWQSRCATYSAPEGTVVVSGASMYAELMAAATQPSSRAPGLVVKEWARFYELISPPGLSSDGTLFVHVMQRPSG